HDGSAFKLRGVSGNAGLFSTAADLARFAQFVLRGGTSRDGRRLLRDETVRLFTSKAVAFGPTTEARALGWQAVPTGESVSGAGTGNSGSRWSRFRIRPAWRRSVSRFPPSQPRCISCFPLPTAGYWPARTRSRSCCDGCRGSAGWRGDSISPAYRSWHGGCTV